MSDADVSAAVAAALSCNWEKAKQINTKLLAQNPEDTDCLNRLGKAHLELGDTKKAAMLFRKVLKINKYDGIAAKNLARAVSAPMTKSKSKILPGPSSQVSASRAFIEEPGITKLVTLVNVAPARTLLLTNYGDPIVLLPKKHTIVVCDGNDCYLGALPDDIAHRLLFLLKGGNTYEGYIKSVSKNMIAVFIKETFRAKKFHNTPSFVPSNTSGDYLSFIREDATPDESKTAQTASDDPEDEEEATASRRPKTYLDEEVDREEA